MTNLALISTELPSRSCPYTPVARPAPSTRTPEIVTPARITAPARAAASAMIVSRMYRRGATRQSTPDLSFTVRVMDSPLEWKVT